MEHCVAFFWRLGTHHRVVQIFYDTTVPRGFLALRKSFSPLLFLTFYKNEVDYMYIPWKHIDTNCIHFFLVFCVSLVLLSTDVSYSRIPGDQGGPLFFRPSFLLRTNWYTTICILDTNLHPNVSKFTQINKLVCAKLYVKNIYVTNLYNFITNWCILICM